MAKNTILKYKNCFDIAYQKTFAILMSQGLFKVRDFIKTLGTIYSLQGFYKVPREYIKSLNFQGLSKQVPENFQGLYKVPENFQGVYKGRLKNIRPSAKYQSLSQMLSSFKNCYPSLVLSLKTRQIILRQKQRPDLQN